MERKKIVLAMSGGIDSSVSAHLLMKEGYEVIGLTFIMSEEPESNGFIDFVNDAKIVAQNLGIKHYVVDLKKEFSNQIINYFVDSYLNGLTPNPCALCNPTIKWKYLIDFADSIGVQEVATGHYAVIKKQNERYFVSKPIDDWKNQTYFLWNLSQEYLKRTVLPLSNLLKSEVREIAASLGLTHQVQKKESYDVCFIKGKDYREFIDDRIKKDNINVKCGYFVTETGEKVGTHEGIAYYTIGQRKGLGIAMGEPYYVKKIDKPNNQVVIAPRSGLNERQFFVKDFSFMKYENIKNNQTFLTRIRYRDKGNLAKISFYGDTLKVEFENEVFGITPGQSAVFYEGDDLVGGGIIV